MALQHDCGIIQWLNADPTNTLYTVTGLGFRPKALVVRWSGRQNLITNEGSTSNENLGIGFATGPTNRRCVFNFSQDNTAAAQTGSGAHNDAIVATTNNAGAAGGLVDVQSFDADGFTLIVTVGTLAADLTLIWDAFGGDIVATIGDIPEPLSSGDQDYAATGFEVDAPNLDQMVMLGGVLSTAALNTNQDQSAGMAFGYITGPSVIDNQCLWYGNSVDTAPNMDTGTCMDFGWCLGYSSPASGASDPLNARVRWTNWNAGGFRLNWGAVGGSIRNAIHLAIKGGCWLVFPVPVKNVSGTNKVFTYDGLPFNLIGMHGINGLALPSGRDVPLTMTPGFGITRGTANKNGHKFSHSVVDGDTLATSNITIRIDFDNFMGGNALMFGRWDVTSWRVNGFTLTNTDSAAIPDAFLGILAFGSQPEQLGQGQVMM